MFSQLKQRQASISISQPGAPRLDLEEAKIQPASANEQNNVVELGEDFEVDFPVVHFDQQQVAVAEERRD